MIRVGVFWYIDNTVYAEVELLAPDTQPLAGKIDSSYEHWRIWEDANKLSGLSLNRQAHEYFDFPRGRVLYDATKASYLIYTTKALLLREIKEKIMQAFGLTDCPVKWAIDEHYTVDRSALESLFDEDD